MSKALRRNINPATILALIALVFAITGGAFAATGSGSGGGGGGQGAAHATLTATVAKAKAKAAPKGKAGPRGPAGPKGATGAAGATGATGPAGATGPGGAQGPQGNPGANGVNGEPGTSVTSVALAKGNASCSKEGGSEFTSASGKTTACNGKEGSPWTAGGVLPAGKTETGTWAFGDTVNGTGHTASVAWSSISFPIPLAGAISETNTHVFSDEEALPTGCKLTSGYLEAASETLCIMIASEVGASVTPAELTPYNLETVELGAGRTGVALKGENLPEGTSGFGTWAVTG